MRIGLVNDQRVMIDELNVYLANLHIIYVKLHNYHWNIIGNEFFNIHEKTQTWYEDTAEELDEVGERILMLEGSPVASLKEYLDLATLQEVASKPISVNNIIVDTMYIFQTMLRHARTIVKLASENDDEGTIGLFSDFIKNYEKKIWMCGAYLSSK